MKAGQESQTAVLVAMGRAIADRKGLLPSFRDPTAYPLLPAAARSRVDQFVRTLPPASGSARFAWGRLDVLSKMMAIRSTVIDEAIRQAGAPQVVILGAGLDGRAWRMPELRDAVVFEVDHPDSQREKRARAAALGSPVGDHRFVPVDFTRDSLDDALAGAGHDVARPTMWVWEGVIMYLTASEVRRTLRVVASRSAPGSRLAAMYHSPGWMLWVVGLLVRRVGEPLRSKFSPETMGKLLAEYGFRVQSDESIPVLTGRLAPALAHDVRFTKHNRIVIAERA